MRIAKTTNQETALKLYVQNIRFSESFYSPIQGLEVTLRNKVHNALSKHYGVEWFMSRKLKLEYVQKCMVQEAAARITPIVILKLIAELNLGFWTGLFGSHYEDIWRKHLRFIFKSATGALKRKDIHSVLDNIRRLRNRIAHHAPIIERDLQSDYKSIIELIALICPETSKWVAMHSSFKNDDSLKNTD
jgi:hypothetical protein